MTLTPGTNVLVMASSLGEEKRDQCTSLLDRDEPSSLDVLRITYSGTPADVVREWEADHDDLPARLGIVDVGDRANVGGSDTESLPENVAVTSANPNDITGLGMRLNNYLNDLDPERQLVVCFDSLTELLQFTDIKPAFKFLHMFTGQLRDAGAIGHFHLDPSALDEQAVNRLKPVFDDAIEE